MFLQSLQLSHTDGQPLLLVSLKQLLFLGGLMSESLCAQVRKFFNKGAIRQVKRTGTAELSRYSGISAKR